MAKVKALTQEWMDAYKAAIVSDPDYKQIAKDWEGERFTDRECRPIQGSP